ncbi:hypothetical protein GCM10010378_02160 [Streptomyces viridochromogenes]
MSAGPLLREQDVGDGGECGPLQDATSAEVGAYALHVVTAFRKGGGGPEEGGITPAGTRDRAGADGV